MIDVKKTEPETGTENKHEKQTWNSLALDIAGRLKAAEKAKNIAIIAMLIINIFLAALNYLNNRDWRELFNSYDFVTQDGSGYNNVNTGEQGDVNNGAESENKEG